MRIVHITALLFVLTVFAEPSFASSKSDVKQGNILYNRGDYNGAAKSYRDALLKRSDSAIANFNGGCALYKKSSYHNAIESFNKAIASGDSKVTQIADYNIGNVQYRIGNSKETSDIKRAKEHYEMALKFYKRAIDLNPQDRDAKFNYEFVENRLKDLKEPKEKHEKEKEEKDKESKETQQEKQEEKKGASTSKEDKQDKTKEEEKEKEGKGGGSGEREREEGKGEPQTKDEKKDEKAKEKAEPQKEEEGQEKEEEGQREEQKGLEAYQEPKPEEEGREMSIEEANMLLEGHKGEEATGRMIRMRRKPTIDMEEPLKDW